MATIETVTLTLTENQDTDTARFVVRYRLRGSLQDVQQQRVYRELIELIGVDEGAGEDGHNELIPGGAVFVGTGGFSNTNSVNRPPRILVVPRSAINEDVRPAPISAIPLRDEIRARLTLIPLGVPPVSLNSNKVTRGDLVVGPIPIPA
jgi:hypothetical protein